MPFSLDSKLLNFNQKPSPIEPESPSHPNKRLTVTEEDIFNIRMMTTDLALEVLDSLDSELNHFSIGSKVISSLNTFILNNELNNVDDLDIDDLILTEEEDDASANSNKQANLREEINNFCKALKDFTVRYKKWGKEFKDIEGALGKILAGGEYIEVNEDNIHFLNNLYLNQNSEFETKLEAANSIFKWLNCLSPLMFNTYKWFIMNQFKNNLQELKNKYYPLEKTFKALNPPNPLNAKTSLNAKKCVEIYNVLEKLRQHICIDIIDSKNKAGLKGVKFISKAASCPIECLAGINTHTANKIGKSIGAIRHLAGIRSNQLARASLNEWQFRLQTPLIDIKDVSTPSAKSFEQIKDEVECFLNSCLDCKTIEEVRQLFKKNALTSVEIPSTFQEWSEMLDNQRYRRLLIQSYYCHTGIRPVISESQVKANLKRRAKEEEVKILHAFPFIQQQINQCQDKDWPQIIEHFKQFHIHLDEPMQLDQTTKVSLADKDHWLKFIQTPNACRCLAQKWVAYNDTVSQLLLQGMRQPLLSKIDVEGKFLRFRMVEYTLRIASSIIQLAICGVQSSLLAATSLIELFISDLSKFNIAGFGLAYICYPLYPNVSFKLEGIGILIAEHFFGIKYKPNEYSLEGYKLIIQIRYIGLVALAHYFISLFQQMILWLNMRLVENCIMGLVIKPLKADHRFIEISESSEQLRHDCKQQIKGLEELLKKLWVKDAKLYINSQTKRRAKYDPIKSVSQALQDVQFCYFSREVLDFFTNNYNIKLCNSNKNQIEADLEKFFSTSEIDFASLYFDNSSAFLKSGSSS